MARASPPYFGWRTLTRHTKKGTNIHREKGLTRVTAATSLGRQRAPRSWTSPSTHRVSGASIEKKPCQCRRRTRTDTVIPSVVPSYTDRETPLQDQSHLPRGSSQRRCKRGAESHQMPKLQHSETPDGRVWIEPLPSMRRLRGFRTYQNNHLENLRERLILCEERKPSMSDGFFVKSMKRCSSKKPEAMLFKEAGLDLTTYILNGKPMNVEGFVTKYFNKRSSTPLSRNIPSETRLVLL